MPFDEPDDLATMAAIPSDSIAALHNSDREEAGALLFLTGPARYAKTGWYLPVYEFVPIDMSDDAIPMFVNQLRMRDGFDARKILV